MEASSGFKSQGSFGIPEQMKRDLEAARLKKDAPTDSKRPPSPSSPVSADQIEEAVAKVEAKVQAKAAEKEKDDPAKDVLAVKDYWEEQLEIKITPTDLRNYIFNLRLVKDDVFVASFPDEKDPEKLTDFRVSFLAHSPEDLAAIDEKMAKFRDKGGYTPDGLENEKALQVLSYGLLKVAGRSMGATAEDRYTNIRKLGGHLVDLIANAWRGFNILLRLSLQEKKLLKKS